MIHNLHCWARGYGQQAGRQNKKWDNDGQQHSPGNVNRAILVSLKFAARSSCQAYEWQQCCEQQKSRPLFYPESHELCQDVAYADE